MVRAAALFGEGGTPVRPLRFRRCLYPRRVTGRVLYRIPVYLKYVCRFELQYSSINVFRIIVC